jgi:phosphoserine aminotransferase
LLGRSHRSAAGKARIAEVIQLTAELLKLPSGWRVGIVPASDTGAVEMALWSLLGARGIDVLAWESFGSDWVNDVLKELKLKDVRSFVAPYGALPDLTQASPERDIVFTWNGTTSGVCVPDGNWISDRRQGLTIVDATSAVFAMDLPWSKIDVATFSWQKVLGGEAQHGVLILSPGAVARLESYTPPWPMPKIFRMTKGGKLVGGIFEGETINTPSMLCVEDALDALRWVKDNGGLAATMKRSQQNLAAVADWVKGSTWAAFLADRAETRSCTSICLKVKDPWFATRAADGQAALIKRAVALLEKEGVALDIGAYRDAPPGLRIWGGATVERSDVAAVLPWLDWAYGTASRE